MFVGDSGVGKTSIINALIYDEEFQNMRIEPTNSVDILFKKLKIKDNNIPINLNMWDFSGNLDAFNIRSEFYVELHAIVYVFDLNNVQSFNNLDIWIRECKKSGGEKLMPVLIGNKIDLKKEVNSNMIDQFINKYKLNYYEISTKESTGALVKKFFYEFSNFIYELLPKEKKK